jgi:hypothetical protein
MAGRRKSKRQFGWTSAGDLLQDALPAREESSMPTTPLSADTLAHIAQAVQATLAQADIREQAWTAAPFAPRLVPEHVAQLEAIGGSSAWLSSRVDDIEGELEVADRRLADCERDLRDLVARLESVRHGLANWAARAIG